jgi:hypothetical protein
VHACLTVSLRQHEIPYMHWMVEFRCQENVEGSSAVKCAALFGLKGLKVLCIRCV